jgi:hypothetical protein
VLCPDHTLGAAATRADSVCNVSELWAKWRFTLEREELSLPFGGFARRLVNFAPEAEKFHFQVGG